MQTNKGGMKALNTVNSSVVRGASAAMLALLLVWCPGCGSADKEQGQRQGPEMQGYRVVPVEVAVAGQKKLSVTRAYSGSVEGEEQANIVAKISERVTKVDVRVGQAVRAGQVAISLEKSGVSSQFYQAEAGYKNSEKTLQRMKSLYEEGAVSLQTLDGAQTAFDVAKANFEAARSAVELTSPIAGVVTAVNVNVGDLAAPGAVLATIARITNMKVIFSINETDVTSVGIGQPVTVYSEARPEIQVEGRIVQMSKSADVGSRSFEMKALFPNTRDAWFKPGMFVKVNIHLSPRDQALVVPAAAIQSDGVVDRVYLVRGGRSVRQEVQLGISDGEHTEVLRGVQPGDSVATVGLNNLKDSSYVKVVNQ